MFQTTTNTNTNLTKTTPPKTSSAAISFQQTLNHNSSDVGGSSLNTSSLNLLGLNKSDLYTPHINALKVSLIEYFASLNFFFLFLSI